MSEQKTELQVYQPERREVSAFGSIPAFEDAQRMANALASSDMVPVAYKGKTANCLIALEMAFRCRMSPLMVMQNLRMVHGSPSWSSTYIIAALNTCGRFEPIRFQIEGSGDTLSCIAHTKDLKTGEALRGPKVTMAMAKAEGWVERNGSKWKTMPELMIQYRAGAFFGRLYAPDILLGMRDEDEQRDIIELNPAEYKIAEPESATAVDKINKKIRSKKAETKPEEQPAPQPAEAPAPTAAEAEGDSHF